MKARPEDVLEIIHTELHRKLNGGPYMMPPDVLDDAARAIYAAVAPLIQRAERERCAALDHLDFNGDLDAWANMKGALIDMEHSLTAPPDAVCWATLNRVLAQLQSARAALAAYREAGR